MASKIRPLVIRGSDSRLYDLRADYEYRLGYACRLTPGQLVVLPKWNSHNLTKN